MKHVYTCKWTMLLLIVLLFIACQSGEKNQLEQSFYMKSNYTMNGKVQIKVHLPSNYHETSKDYPVLYMTDADWYFGLAQDMIFMMEFEGKDIILVGIGYGDRKNCRTKRLKDLGSDVNADSIHAYTLYQSFLKNELFPKIESRYRAQSKNRTFFGWSLGALFANHLLYEQRDLFDNYILAGGRFPMYWSAHMDSTLRQDRNNRPLSLYVGFPEKDASREAYINMLKSLKNEDLADLFLHWDIYANQGHNIESTADALWKGLHYTYSQKQLTPTLMNRVQRDGLDAALKNFEAWKVLRPHITDFSPSNLLEFSHYLNDNDKQSFMEYFNKKYPPKTIRFQVESESVPQGSAVYITGNQSTLAFWNPSEIAMKQNADGFWTKSIQVMKGTTLEYKFTLGSWSTEGLDANGQAIPNYKLNVEKDSLVTHVVSKWK